MKIEYSVDTKHKEVGKIYFDSIPISASGFPIGDSLMYKIMVTHAPKFLEYWQNRLGMKANFKIVNTLNSEGIDEIKATDVPQLVICLNQLAANNPALFGQITIKPYDIVDSSIPMISGMFGYNDLYAIYKGRHNYMKKIAYSESSDSFTVGGDIMRDVYQYFCGAILNPLSYENNFGKRSFWFSGAYDGMYDLPRYDGIKGYINPNGSRDRYNLNLDTLAFEPLIIDPDLDRRKWYISDMLYVGFNRFSSTYVILHRTKKDYLTMRNLMSLKGDNNYSFCAMYKVIDSQNDKRVAVIIKAIGIDTLKIEDVDFLKYDIEAVQMGDLMQPFEWIKPIEEAEVYISDKIGGKLIFRISSMRTGSSRFYPGRQAFSSSLSRNLFFRLRDKATGYVGELSNSSIMAEHYACNGLAPFRYMMKSVKGD